MGGNESVPATARTTGVTPELERAARRIEDQVREDFMAWADAMEQELMRQPQEAATLWRKTWAQREFHCKQLEQNLAILQLPPWRVAQACFAFAALFDTVRVRQKELNEEKHRAWSSKSTLTGVERTTPLAVSLLVSKRVLHDEITRNRENADNRGGSDQRHVELTNQLSTLVRRGAP